MTRVLGIDLGRHSIKIAELELSSKTPQILGLYEVCPREDQDEAAALREFFAQSNIRAERIAININSASTLTKRFDFPFHDKKKVQMAVEGEWMDLLPFELDGYTVETRHMGRKGRTHFYLSGLCSTADILKVNDLCVSACIKPNAILLDAEALAQLALRQHLPRSQSVDSYVVVDFGYDITKLAIIRGSYALKGKPKAPDLSFIEPEILELRHIDKGSREWIQWIANRRRVSTEEALQWLIHRAEIQPKSENEDSIREDLSDDIKSALRPVVVEIYQTLQSSKVRTGHYAELLFVTGSMSEIRGLKEFLEHELGLKVEAWPLFLGFNAMEAVRSPSNEKSFATALSLAHSFASSRSSLLNFRRNTQQKTRFLTETFNQLLSPQLKPAFAVLGVVFAFVWIYSIGGAFFIEAQQRAVEKDLSGEFRRLDNTLGERARNFVNDPTRARQLFEKLKKQKLANAVPEIETGPHPQVAILDDFSVAAPNGIKVAMIETQKAQNGILIEAEITHNKEEDRESISQNVDNYVKNLQRANYVDVQVSTMAGGRIHRLKARWNPPSKKKGVAR
jgi:Tfp pilus assembly PilM family ATPase